MALAPRPVRERASVLQREERAAWGAYLEATLGQAEDRYREVEPWAWKVLQARLLSIHRRREQALP